MPDLKGATKKAILDGKISQLDGIGSNIGEFIEEAGLSIVENLVGDFISRVHSNINAITNFSVTGAIGDITLSTTDNSVNVMANKQLILQSRGVNGSKVKLYPNSPHSYSTLRPPIEPIVAWIKAKKMGLINNEKYSLKKPPFHKVDASDDDKIKKMAWAISTKIFNEGFKGHDIYEKEIPKLVEDLQNEIGDFVISAINQIIDIKPSAKRIIS